MSELLDIKVVALPGFPSDWRFRNVDMSSHHSSIDDGSLARFGVAEPGSKCNESEANEGTRTRQNMSSNRGNLIVRVQNSVFIYRDMIWWYHKSNGKLKAMATWDEGAKRRKGDACRGDSKTTSEYQTQYKQNWGIRES